MEMSYKKYNFPRYLDYASDPPGRKRHRGKPHYNAIYLKLVDFMKNLQGRVNIDDLSIIDWKKINVYVSDDKKYIITGDGMHFSGCAGCGDNSDIKFLNAMYISIDSNNYTAIVKLYTGGSITPSPCGGNIQKITFVRDYEVKLYDKEKEFLNNILPKVLEALKNYILII